MGPGSEDQETGNISVRSDPGVSLCPPAPGHAQKGPLWGFVEPRMLWCPAPRPSHHTRAAVFSNTGEHLTGDW